DSIARGNGRATNRAIIAPYVDVSCIRQCNITRLIGPNKVALDELISSALGKDANRICRDEITRCSRRSAHAQVGCRSPKAGSHALSVALPSQARGVGTQKTAFDHDAVGVDKNCGAPAMINHQSLDRTAICARL